MTKVPGMPVKITRAEIERHLHNLDRGNPLTPSAPELGWTGDEVLALAGICLSEVTRRGPEASGTDEHTFNRDTHCAMITYSGLAKLAAAKEFERKFGDHVSGFIEVSTEDNSVTLNVVRSAKPS